MRYTFAMQFVRPPAWRYYPQPDRPRVDLRQLIEAMETVGSWLETDWWLRPKGGKDTRDITRELERQLPAPDNATSSVGIGLQRGWNLETREHYPKMPFLYAEGDASIQSVEPDAVFVDDHDRLTLVEIEGGGALTNYRGMKDVVEALLLPNVDYVALIVPFRAHHTFPYDYYNNLVTSLYAQQIVQAHLRGLLVVGY
jgi:hypothetical protein